MCVCFPETGGFGVWSGVEAFGVRTNIWYLVEKIFIGENMKKKRPQSWFEKTRPKQLVQFTNMKAKIGDYETILPLAADKVKRIVLICDIFISVYNFVEQSRAKMKNLTDWQDLIYTAEGDAAGEPAPAAPVFQTLALPAGAFVGIFDEFQEHVADIKRADNYTRGIGEDLMIVAAEGGEIDKDEMSPELKLAANGYKVNIAGSLQGLKAIRVEYLKKGSTIPQTFFLNKLPGEITLIPTQAGEPETGQFRAVFFEDNADVGEWSPNYALTIG
jgi:hypothetical protein